MHVELSAPQAEDFAREVLEQDAERMALAFVTQSKRAERLTPISWFALPADRRHLVSDLADLETAAALECIRRGYGPGGVSKLARALVVFATPTGPRSAILAQRQIAALAAEALAAGLEVLEVLELLHPLEDEEHTDGPLGWYDDPAVAELWAGDDAELKWHAMRPAELATVLPTGPVCFLSEGQGWELERHEEPGEPGAVAIVLVLEDDASEGSAAVGVAQFKREVARADETGFAFGVVLWNRSVQVLEALGLGGVVALGRGGVVAKGGAL